MNSASAAAAASIAENPHWWAQPAATVLAAVIALAAAGVAYWGVSRQIKANARNVQAQIDATAAQHSMDRADAWNRAVRAERLEMFYRADDLSSAVTTAAVAFRFREVTASSAEGTKLRADLKGLARECQTQARRMRLNGLDEVASELSDLGVLASFVAQEDVPAPGDDDVPSLGDALHEKIRAELATDEIRHSPDDQGSRTRN